MIGDFNRRITLQSWTTTQDEAGGSAAVIDQSYTIWAKVEDRSGRTFGGEQQEQWSYDYKVTFRYEKSRKVNSNMTILYDGKKLLIRSLSYADEGQRKFCVARCSATDNMES